MKKLLLLLLLMSTASIQAMESKEKEEKLIKKYEAHATLEWLPTTIAFMKDPKNAETKEAKILKRYIEMVGETKELYQSRYSIPEKQAIEQACKETPIDTHDWNYIECGSRCGSDGLGSCREEWENMFSSLEDAIRQKS